MKAFLILIDSKLPDILLFIDLNGIALENKYFTPYFEQKKFILYKFNTECFAPGYCMGLYNEVA